VGGRRWLIRCQPLTSYTHDFLSLYPHFAFLGSLILTSIVASYLVSTRKRTARIAILVNERTRELRASQEKYRLLAEENEILSLRDALTEILNRRGLDEKLEEECARSMRAKSSLACILIDIDHFKMYNDNYGHQKGDECLRETAQILNSCMLRAGDFVSRYGGEEFCIILPNINLEGAAVVAQRLQDAMARAEIPHLYSDVADRITLSMGLEAFVPSHDLASDQLIEHADKALYAAKRSGRNRFVSYSSSIAKVT
jgi:diguanylate cyclase (GGDEF)-like protein